MKVYYKGDALPNGEYEVLGEENRYYVLDTNINGTKNWFANKANCDIILETPKSLIKTGYMVKLKDDKLHHVVETTAAKYFVDETNRFVEFESYDDDLKCKTENLEELDVMEIYGFRSFGNLLGAFEFSTDKRKLIWRREPEIFLNSEEIDVLTHLKALGYTKVLRSEPDMCINSELEFANGLNCVDKGKLVTTEFDCLEEDVMYDIDELLGGN